MTGYLFSPNLAKWSLGNITLVAEGLLFVCHAPSQVKDVCLVGRFVLFWQPKGEKVLKFGKFFFNTRK